MQKKNKWYLHRKDKVKSVRLQITLTTIFTVSPKKQVHILTIS